MESHCAMLQRTYIPCSVISTTVCLYILKSESFCSHPTQTLIANTAPRGGTSQGFTIILFTFFMVVCLHCI